MTNRLMALRVMGVMLAVLVTSLLISAGCNTSAQPDQALKQQNEKLQKKLDDQKEEQQKERRAEEKKKEEAQQADLEKQVNDLQKQVDKQQKQNKQKSDDQSSGSSSASPDVGIENSSVSPSQAPEGVVVVSPDFNTSAATAEEASAINGAIAYYQAAEVGDYYTTYSLLSYEDQTNYTEDYWVEANTVLGSAAGEFVVTDAYPEDVGNGYSTYAVLVTVYMSDGSSFNRQTYFSPSGVLRDPGIY